MSMDNKSKKDRIRDWSINEFEKPKKQESKKLKKLDNVVETKVPDEPVKKSKN